MEHYKVTLSEQERAELQGIAGKGTHAASKVINVLIIIITTTIRLRNNRCGNYFYRKSADFIKLISVLYFINIKFFSVRCIAGIGTTRWCIQKWIGSSKI